MLVFIGCICWLFLSRQSAIAPVSKGAFEVTETDTAVARPPPDMSWSPPTVLERSLAGLVAAVVLTYRLARRAVRWLVDTVHSLAAGATDSIRRTRTFTGDGIAPSLGVIVRPLRVVLFGRRPGVSVLAALLAPILALTAAWAVGTSVGFDPVREWVVGTWTGRDPHLPVLLAAAALVAVGAASAAVNSGLLPTSLLVAAPVFGVALTRYGTEPMVLSLGPVVSLPDAVAVAALLAVAFGLPLALAGFLLGGALRRVFRVFEGGREPVLGHET